MLSGIHLPQDLIEEILVKLPVKSLLRFKCVSKSWYSLITDHSFTDKHLRWSNSVTKDHGLKLMFVVYGLRKLHPSVTLISKDKPDCYNEPDHIEILHKKYNKFYGQCNGIFCLHVINFDEVTNNSSDDDKGDIILWNPTIREVKVIPMSQCLPPEVIASSASFGFGYDPLTKDYKIVRVPDRPLNGVIIAQVYNLSTNSWRILDVAVEVPNFTAAIQTCGTYLNGVYYWFLDSREEVFILSFHFSTEVFERIELPSLEKYYAYFGRQVFVLEECIAVYEHNMRTGGYNIWIMKDNSWTNRFEIRLSYVASALGYVGSVLQIAGPVLGSWGDNEILMASGEYCNEVISYNLQNHHVHMFEAHSGAEIHCFDYVQSLVPLVAGRRTPFNIGSD